MYASIFAFVYKYFLQKGSSSLRNIKYYFYLILYIILNHDLESQIHFVLCIEHFFGYKGLQCLKKVHLLLFKTVAIHPNLSSQTGREIELKYKIN